MLSMTKEKRPTANGKADVYDDGHLYIEHNRFYVTCAGKPLYSLTRKEFLILSCLARAVGHPVSNQDIWAQAWGKGTQFNKFSFRVQISSLRRKLSDFGIEVVAVVHFGYRLVVNGTPHDTDQHNQTIQRSQQ